MLLLKFRRIVGKDVPFLLLYLYKLYWC